MRWDEKPGTPWPSDGSRGLWLLTVFALAFLLPMAVVEGQGTTPSTSQFGSMPSERASLSAIWDPRDRPAANCPSGCAYLFGGSNEQGGLGQIVQFNPAQNNVNPQVGLLPSPRYLTSAIWTGEEAYIFGGYNEQQRALNEIVRFHPATGSVITMAATLPQDVYYASAVWTGTHAFIFGGRNEEFATGQILRYDPRADSVQDTGNSLPTTLIGSSAVWTGKAAYIFGGWEGTAPRDTIVEYDPTAGQFGSVDVKTARLPAGRAYTSATWDGQFAYLFGGMNSNFRYDQVLRYDPVRDSLVTLVSNALPAARSETAAVSDGNVSYVFGGFDGSRFAADILRVQPPVVATTTSPPLATTPPPTLGTTRLTVPTGTRGTGDTFPESLTSQPVLVTAGAATLVAIPLGYLAVRALRKRQKPVVASRFRSIGAPPTATELAETGAPALAAREVSVALGKRVVVKSVSLDVPRANLTFLLGMSGSGKSTLLRALVGLNPFQGDVQIEGVPLRPGRSEAKRLVGYVPQELQLYENLTPIDNVAYFASQYKISADRAQQLGMGLLADLGLAEATKQRLSRLSGGQRRRVSIAAALVHEPRLVVLDEPTSGLDFSSRKALWSVLQRLARDRGIAVLASTHFIDDTQYANRVGIMFEGRLVALGTPRELIRSLPGGGRCVEIEFEDLGAADRARLEKLLPAWRAKGLVERAEYHAFSVRYFSKDPAAASRSLPDELFRQRFAVRSTRLDDVNLEDVFVYYTGRPFEEGKP